MTAPAGAGGRRYRLASPVACTLAAAAAFSPLRRRVQKMVDRRFNRARYDADRTIAAFAARLQDAASPGLTRADLLGTMRGALEPAHATLCLAAAAPAQRHQPAGTTR